MFRRLLFFGLVYFFTLIANAQTWEATFEAGAVAASLKDSDVKILIAAAGGSLDEAKQAAAALTSALRQNDDVNLVMSDEALGNLDAADDASIVRDAAKFKMDLIYVVRVFEKGGAGQYSLVVTVYDSTGQAVNGLSGEKGVALQASAEGGASQGISNQASEAVSEITKETGSSRSDAESQYLERFVWFEDWVAINIDTGTVAGRWTVPYKGKYKEQLKGKDFYTYINQPELAAQYRKRSITRWSIYGVGLGVFIAGFSVTMVGVGKLGDTVMADNDACYSLDMFSDEYDECQAAAEAEADKKNRDSDQKAKTLLIAGGVVTGVGLIGMMAPLFIRAHPVDPVRARKLADEFNQNLKTELGLPEDYIPSESARLKPRPKAQLAVAPALSPQDAGLTLRLTF